MVVGVWRSLGWMRGLLVVGMVAALVFAGLTWVSVVALRVEAAQRQTEAVAELDRNLRLALWRLDGRMLPVLGVEDSRPYHHYLSLEPGTSPSGRLTVPTPLLAAPLPDWMTLHFQLDPVNGWTSPQVLTPQAAGRIALLWPDFPLRNNTPQRAAVLQRLHDQFPPVRTCEILAARERAFPSDERPFAAPWLDPQRLPDAAMNSRPPVSAPKPPPPPDMGPVPVPPVGSESPPWRLWGWEWPARVHPTVQPVPSAHAPTTPPPVAKPPAFPPAAPPPGGAVGRPAFPLGEHERLWLEFRHRALMNQRAVDEAKNAGQEFPSLDRTPTPATPHPPLLAPRTSVAVFGWAWRLALGSLGGTESAPAVAPGVERPLPASPFDDEIVLRPPHNIHLGAMRPYWLTATDGSLLLVVVRAVRTDDQTIYQGVVLNWPQLQVLLKQEVHDIFPQARLVAITDPARVTPDRTMTVLPVQLDIGELPPLPAAGWTPLRIGLVLAWAAAILAFAAIGWSSWSLVDLANRRIRFVSAVTHELRTPLTCLRLYLDLLSSGLIRDEAQRQEYLHTLSLESDRLHRLIDNVLNFAQLEKRSQHYDLKPVLVRDLLDHLQLTWEERLATDGYELIVNSTLPPHLEVRTDPAIVYQIVANLIDNARKYSRDAKDQRIWLSAKAAENGRVAIEVEDRGPGVPPRERKAIFQPFRRGSQAESTGGAGLGLSLARQWAELIGGSLGYRPPEGGVGACFRLELPRPPADPYG